MNIIFDCIYNIWYVVFELERAARISQFVHFVSLPAINYDWESQTVIVLEWFAFFLDYLMISFPWTKIQKSWNDDGIRLHVSSNGLNMIRRKISKI